MELVHAPSARSPGGLRVGLISHQTDFEQTCVVICSPDVSLGEMKLWFAWHATVTLIRGQKHVGVSRLYFVEFHHTQSCHIKIVVFFSGSHKKLNYRVDSAE